MPLPLTPALRAPSCPRSFFAALCALALAVVVSAAEPARALNFLAVGDWGRDGQFGQREVGAEMGRVAAQAGVQFVVSLGDNFYPDGVASVEAAQWRTSFEDIYTAPSLGVPWYVVLGNHDYHLSAQAQIDYTLHSPRWKMPARYYSVVRRIDADTTAEFFFLDTNPYVEGYRAKPEKYRGILEQDPAAQTAWLDAALARSTAQWKIVCAHHPLVSSSPTHGDTKELVATILPVMQKHGVRLYLNGHEHDMQHLRAHGIDFICSGAGSQTRKSATDARTQFALGETSGFLLANLTRDAMHFRFIDATGATRYEATVPRIAPAASAARETLTPEPAAQP